MEKSEPHNRSELDAYLDHLRRKKYSERTLTVYDYALEQLLLFLAASGVERLQDTRREHLDGYRLHLVERKLTESSLEIFLRSARQFFNWLEDRQAIFDNPARGLIVPKPVRPLLPAPSEEEMTKLLAQPDVSMPTGIRDRALLETVYCCGLRREETIRLTIFDPDLSGQTLRVLGKGRKERVLPLGRHAVKWLKTYLHDARPKLVGAQPDLEALWIDKDGKAMTGNAYAQQLKRYAEQARLKTPLSPHAIRRACATHMLQHGAHPVQIQMLLGHAGMKHLGQYLRVSIRDLKKAHTRCNPGK